MNSFKKKKNRILAALLMVFVLEFSSANIVSMLESSHAAKADTATEQIYN